MTGTNYKTLWKWKHLSSSLALSTSYQSSSRITAPVHSPSIIQPKQLPLPLLYLFSSFAPHYFYFYFAHSSTANLPFQCFTCYIVFTLPPWPVFVFTSLISPHLLTLYIDLFLLYYWLYVCFTPCVTVLLYVSHCFALSWQGRNCKWELVLN